MKFLFIGHNYDTASQYMRGISMAKALNRQGIQAEYVINEKIRNVTIDSDTVCIFLKVVWPDSFELVKKKKAYLVYDIIDNWTWGNLKYDFNCVISSNELHKKHIATLFKGKILTIPHLHTNISRKRKVLSNLRTVGYIGLDKQFGITNEMRKYCKKSKLQWYQASGGSPKTSEQETLNVDLGLIYATAEMSKLGLNYENIIKYKPATKLTNFMSYGIPALFNSTPAYMEVINQDEELKYLVINSIDEMYKKVFQLNKDPKRLQHLSDRCFLLAEKYHQDHAKEYYLNLL